ncbi:MAG TPA: cytochrome c biogenesis protein CcsA [Candidatus Nanoarchaeia archaeon]|nr:cytochrome c biogenesis protein CcsA [Candidatus Nanoarchaeia archaeon]
MNIGNLLLFISLLSTCLAAVFIFKNQIKTSILLIRIAAASITLSVMFLTYAFIFLDFSLYYVWQHSSAELSVLYRIAAILVGQEGTFLIWAWLSLLIVLTHVELYGMNERTNKIINMYAIIGCTFLLILSIIMTPFRSIYLVGDATLPSIGNSISPELTTILMPLHIFTAFAAYGFALIPAAMSLAYLTERDNMPKIKNYLRLTWLFLSICLISGGFWANRLLGWNDFWQWDPLQSATMCVWLLSTASLHAVVRFNAGEYKRLLPLLCIGVFLSSLFTTLVARSDVFGSIHSFPGTPTWWMIVIFIAAVFVISLILALKFDIQEERYSERIHVFKPSHTFYFTILILIIMAFIVFWGPVVYLILYFMGKDITISKEFYNSLFYPLVLVLTYLTGICMLYGRVKNKTLAYVCIIFFVMSVILSLGIPFNTHTVVESQTGYFFGKIFGSISLLSFLPAFFFVTGNVIFKMLKDFKIKNRTASLHLTGINFIHLGFVFIIMGAILSTSFSTTYNFKYNISEKDTYKENGDIGVRFLDYDVKQIGADWVQFLDVEVNDGRKYNATSVFLKSNQFGYISRPAIKHGLLFDTRIEFQGSLPHLVQIEAINVKIKKQPFASLIWIGSLLMIAGVIFTISSDVMRRKHSKFNN